MDNEGVDISSIETYMCTYRKIINIINTIRRHIQGDSEFRLTKLRK